MYDNTANTTREGDNTTSNPVKISFIQATLEHPVMTKVSNKDRPAVDCNCAQLVILVCDQYLFLGCLHLGPVVVNQQAAVQFLVHVFVRTSAMLSKMGCSLLYCWLCQLRASS